MEHPFGKRQKNKNDNYGQPTIGITAKQEPEANSVENETAFTLSLHTFFWREREVKEKIWETAQRSLADLGSEFS